LISLHVNDLGGDSNVSEGERAIIRRAATLIVELERMERNFALAEGADILTLEVYQRAANSMRRLLEAVGLQRRSRDVTPSLSEYLEASHVTAQEVDAAPVSDETLVHELPGAAGGRSGEQQESGA
jgi:hypothetical protein